MKSHVSTTQHQCPICLVMHDTGEILFHKRLAQALNHTTVTGHSPCPRCQDHLDNDYLALVETRDPNPGRSAIGMYVPRSGNFAFVKREVFPQFFNVPAPELPMVFVEPGVIDKIRSMTEDGGTELPLH